ncbi:MAG: methionine adenosyltransferase domain-containing protein, partial [Bacilli bacterium]|nr:methionine adenosyltransferase domain-containing protein [Bacilli bacterium]
TIVLSTQHDEFDTDDARMRAKIEKDVREIVLPRLIKSLPERTAKLFDGTAILHVNPTGKFVIGGPAGDTGLTGRKIIVDTYGGRGAHGGGAFSGKDPSKVDRSASLYARYIAKNLVAAGAASKLEVELSYAIGVAEPLSVSVETFGTAKIDEDVILRAIKTFFDARPGAINAAFHLNEPTWKYSDICNYGCFGRPDLDLPWEKLDKVAALKDFFAKQA